MNKRLNVHRGPLKVVSTLLGTFSHKLFFSKNLRVSVWIKVGKPKSDVTLKAIIFSFFTWYIKIS